MTHPEPYDAVGNRQRVFELRDRGVDVWGPEKVYVAADVPLENIEPGVVIRQANLGGPELQIGRGARIGVSGHAHVANCQIGRDVELGAGTYDTATILDGARVRGFAELRPGTLLEEQVEAAHSVAFKNTVLTATVVAGSLINYCDLFTSGGTSRTNHSEVGSGVVHFNFDPRGDKWGSLIGDVRGLLLRSAPIFVGGQCGLVAPLQVGFGSVTAAGSVVRGDVEDNRLHFENAEGRSIEDFDPEIYAGLRRKFLTTALLIGNLRALDRWYELVRLPFAEDYQKPLYRAAQQQCRIHIAERIERLQKVIDKLDRSITKSSESGDDRLIACQDEHRRLIEHREQIVAILTSEPESSPAPAEFLTPYEKARCALSHIDALRQVGDEATQSAAEWIYSVAREPAARLGELLD